MLIIIGFIIIINVLIFIIFGQIREINIYFGMNEYFFEQKWWFQAITNMFIHGSSMHLGMNMIALLQMGLIMKNTIGNTLFTSLYIFGGILTSILSLIFTLMLDIHVNMIGASGAISVLFGFYGFLQKEYLKGFSIAILLMSFAPLLLGINIAWYAHIIGFLIGILSALIYIKYKLRQIL